MSTLVESTRHGTTLVLTINNPPVNVLSPGVPEGLIDGLRAAEQDPEVTAVVVIGGGRTFVAGADIRTFNMPRDKAPDVRGMVAAFDASTKPVVAALHGTALGGGLELALACNYRVATPDAQLGLPEVKLGLLPGAGGTQRMARLVGVETALPMMVSGDPVKAPKAKEMGLVDEIVDGDLLQGALAFAQRVAAERPLPRASEKTAYAPDAYFEGFRAHLNKTARGLFSPFKIVELAEAAVKRPFDEGTRMEADFFMQCVQSEQSAGLRHVFFAEREAGRVDGLSKDAKPRDIRKAVVIGAGTMGGGIAMNFANAGIPVTVVETKQEALDRGLGIISKNYANTVSKGRLTQDAMDKRVGLISGSLDLQVAADADIVIEAVFENMDVKKDIFRRLDDIAKDGAILATNTSTLDVNEIAAVTKRPQDVIGLHFFSPANVMKLLEIVRADRTADDVLATALALSKTIRKVGVVVGVCDGFVGNRMIHAYGKEAALMLEEGALPQQVDKVMHDLGLPMGPFEMSDMAGLDIGYAIRQRQAQEAGQPEPNGILDRIVKQGRLGQKSGAGIYRYEPGNRKAIPDPEITKLIEEYSAEQGVTRREFTDEEIRKRLVYALVNTGAQILDEGIAQRSSDIDVIYVYGYGFPPYRGGPMFYADQIGLGSVLMDIKQFHETHGERWTPAPLLERLAQNGSAFSQYRREVTAGGR